MEAVLKLDIEYGRIWQAIYSRSCFHNNSCEFDSSDKDLISLWLDKALIVAPPEKVVVTSPGAAEIGIVHALLNSIELLNINHEMKQALLIHAWEVYANFSSHTLKYNSGSVTLFKKKIKELKRQYGFSKPKIGFWG